MRRVCVINVAGLSRGLLDRMGELWMNSLACPPRAMSATFPAVAASVQTSMTTGVAPGVHGVVAGGIFRRQFRTFSLDERSNTLLNKKRFWHSRRLPRRLRVAMLFWSNPLAGAADAVIGAYTYGPLSQPIADHPRGLYQRLAGRIGQFDSRLVRGPGASWRAGEWIASAAAVLWREQEPDLQWVSLPGVNFEATRHGPQSQEVCEALREVDRLARELSAAVAAAGGETLIVSDGGYVGVGRAVLPNAALREAGLLRVRTAEIGEELDVDNSRAFALVDHQVAHVYCDDEAATGEAAAVLAGLEGVAAVRPRQELFCPGLGHDRAGEIIVLSEPDAWLAYPWWQPGEPAPAPAEKTDVAGKCGYDPCELFAGREAGTIDPDPGNVRASRGLTSVPVADQCVLGATCEIPGDLGAAVTDVPEVVRRILFGDTAGGRS